MVSLLFACVPIHGHVSPLLALARPFVERGDRVRFLTGSRFATSVGAAGAEHVSLPPGADFDDRAVDESFPDRRGLSPIRAIAYDIEHVFVAPAEPQYRALRELIAAEPPDVVVVDPAFAAGSVLVLRPTAERPPVVVAGVVPLILGSRDVAPFGLGLPPFPGPLGRLRNRALGRLTAATVLRRAYAVGRDIQLRLAGRAVPDTVLDWLRGAEAIVQCTVPSFEYPRSDAPATLSYVGPVTSSGIGDHGRPGWWGELDPERPIVHVTQGTIANTDPDELIMPTVEAFADRWPQVVIATGGLPVDRLGSLPHNVFAAEFLPYDELLPRTDVFVTNGGYGGAHFALRYGVPMVVAPGQEDKVEVAARIAWSGAGRNLRTQRPTSRALRRAVEDVLRRPGYRAAAQRLAEEISAAPGPAGFVAAVDAVMAQRRRR